MDEQRNKALRRAINLVDVVKNQVFGRDLPVLRDVPSSRSWTSPKATYYISTSQLPKEVQLEVYVRQALKLGLSQIIQ